MFFFKEGTESSSLRLNEIRRKLFLKASDVGILSAHRSLCCPYLWCPEPTWQSPLWCVIGALPSQKGLRGGWQSTRPWSTPSAWDMGQTKTCSPRWGLAHGAAAVSSLTCSWILFPSKGYCGSSRSSLKEPSRLKKSDRLASRSQTIVGLHATIRIQRPFSFCSCERKTGPSTRRRQLNLRLSCLPTSPGVQWTEI